MVLNHSHSPFKFSPLLPVYQVLREDLTEGQRVRAFTVTSGGRMAAQGESIGNKFIGMLDRVYRAGTTLAFEVTLAAPGAACLIPCPPHSGHGTPSATTPVKYR